MPVRLPAPSQLFAVPGVRLGSVEAGIRKANRRDVCVILLDAGTQVAGVFTQNRFCAAPVSVCKQHLAQGTDIRALVINTGCANAGTGEVGLRDALTTCTQLAELMGVRLAQVLPFSTGVILENLPMPRLLAALAPALQSAQQGQQDQWLAAAHAIMTTDTAPKAASRQIQIEGKTVTITGIAKGAGMIHPNMATMLGFIACDAVIAAPLLQQLCREAADQSFNCITIDGDTSTNDSFMLMATQQAGHAPIHDLGSASGQALQSAVLEIAQQLAQMIVRDGEGATKFITIEVSQARHRDEARRIAYAIAHSPLVKTAFFASDPNLGRILAAIGYAGVNDLDVSQIDLFLDDVHVASHGGRHPNYQEADGQRVMKQEEIHVRVQLGQRGTASATVWTCDLSHDYVSINADYRS